MVDLPNDKWLRSPKMPEYAVCLDPSNRFFGWKMVEHPDGRWVSVERLTLDEAHKAKGYSDFKDHQAEVVQLIEMLAGLPKPKG